MTIKTTPMNANVVPCAWSGPVSGKYGTTAGVVVAVCASSLIGNIGLLQKNRSVYVCYHTDRNRNTKPRRSFEVASAGFICISCLYMRTLTRSERQWIISFAAVDAMFWFLMLAGCILDPEMCGVGTGFAATGFFAPFWLLLLWSGPLLQSVTAQLVAIGVVGLLCHCLIGWAFGRAQRERVTRWYVSIPVAFAVVMAISIAGNAAGVLMGFII